MNKNENNEKVKTSKTNIFLARHPYSRGLARIRMCSVGNQSTVITLHNQNCFNSAKLRLHTSMPQGHHGACPACGTWSRHLGREDTWSSGQLGVKNAGQFSYRLIGFLHISFSSASHKTSTCTFPAQTHLYCHRRQLLYQVRQSLQLAAPQLLCPGTDHMPYHSEPNTNWHSLSEMASHPQ